MMITIKKIIFIIFIFLFSAVPVNANETLITIVLPDNTIAETTTELVKAPEQSVNIMPKLYPVSVNEQSKNGRREIIKTYELSQNEKPSDIPRDSFECDGYYYEIADITKKENVKTEEKNHIETVQINSATNEFSAILELLPKTKDYDNGGFIGTLTLDVSSITVEQAGTRSVPKTISETREYPHLSSNDPSFVPRAISDKYNRTLTLSNLTWQTHSNNSIDGYEMSDSYTAVVTYTGTAYMNQITGYDVTAQYSGIISKTVEGKTVYTALFVGTQIVFPSPEIVEIPTETATTEPATEFIEMVTEPETESITIETFAETTTVSETITEPFSTEPATEPHTEAESLEIEQNFELSDEVSSDWFTAFIIVLSLCIALIITGVFLFVKKKVQLK